MSDQPLHPVDTLASAASTPATPTPPPLLQRALAWVKHFKTAIVAIAGVGAVLSGLVGYYGAYKTVVGTPPTAATAQDPTTINPLSIMVLPFANQTDDKDKAYIADGLTSSITSDLSRISDAFVAPTSTAFTYRDKSLTAQQIGLDAGVRFVLQGSVLSAASKVRISVQLVNTQTKAQIWSETFDGELTDLFALQDRVTTLVGNSLGREMVIAAARASQRTKSSATATELKLQARAWAIKPVSLESYEQQELLYRQVLKLQPDDTRAMAALAQALTESTFNILFKPKSARASRYAEGKALAIKVLGIDPEEPQALFALGMHAQEHDDYDTAERAYRKWLTLEPKNPRAYVRLGALLNRKGKPQQAIELLNQAIALDPRHVVGSNLFNMGLAYFQLGDNDAAITWVERGIDASPHVNGFYPYLAMAYRLKGNAAKSQDWVKRVNEEFARDADDIGFKLSGHGFAPTASSPVAYKDYWEKRFIPAWRETGLPE